MTIRGKPNVDVFLDGGAEGAQNRKEIPARQTVVVKVAPIAPATLGKIDETKKRTKKLFELPEGLIADLEQRCVDERRQLGRRVTQMEIVEKALGAYLYGNI